MREGDHGESEEREREEKKKSRDQGLPGVYISEMKGGEETRDDLVLLRSCAPMPALMTKPVAADNGTQRHPLVLAPNTTDLPFTAMSTPATRRAPS